MACGSDNDLPLVSNIKDILITHYMFYFSCKLKKRCFTCHAVLFLEPVINKNKMNKCDCIQFYNKSNALESSLKIPNSEYLKDKFIMILDCYKIIVQEVTELNLVNSKMKGIKYKAFNSTLFQVGEQLKFSTDKWSLKIWKESCCRFCFPRVIRISYKTIPEGPSLLWVIDQDKNPAVFTYGACVNNRSLFPCQEPPSAMATWEATVDVEECEAVVLMSGDEDAQIRSVKGKTCFYYFTKNILPLSTLCLAIGFWQEHTIVSKNSSDPKCRIFSPPSLMDRAIQELFEYVPYCLKISRDIFGTYPFPRIDFLIVPPTFGSLGMASPNIVFLSQSLLTGDASLSSRIAHEIAHGWFGLLIGASDWTEEWLSEGFATFVEDYFHVRTMNMSESSAKNYIEMKAYIRLKTLLQEISNTDEDLQVLRPSKGEVIIETVDGVNAAVLKNGQNPIKGFIQVHYIKGYFLLKHLAGIVDIDNFLLFLKGYIEKYCGKLVTSKEFLTEFFSWFPCLQCNLNVDTIYDEWLHNSGINSDLKKVKPSPENQLYVKAMEEVKKWRRFNSLSLKTKNKRRKYEMDNNDVISEQLILILENLLDEPKLSPKTLQCLSDYYSFFLANAEVQHRWFELVVKYRFKSNYEELKQFLSNHLAMGVYLFGEMILAGDSILKTMAKEIYLGMKAELEPNYISTIEKMLFDAGI